MMWRTESLEGRIEQNDEDGFVLKFPPLPDGAVPCAVEMEFDNHRSHQPSAYVLHLEVPRPDGNVQCGSDCPVCYPKEEAHAD